MAALPDTEIQALSTAASGITSTTVFPIVDTADATQVAAGSAYKVTAAQVAEYVRDTIGTALTQGANITITVNDGADTITVAVSGLDQADIAPAVNALTDGATVTLNATLGRTHRVTLGGNRTLAITNPTDGQVIELEIIQDGTGSRTLTLPAEVRFSTTAPSSLYVLSTTAGKRDYLTLKYNSAATKWDAVGFLAGF